MCGESMPTGLPVLMILLSTQIVMGSFSTDVLWQSCNTTICGRPALSFRCELTEIILINNFPSTSGSEANRQLQERSYMNLRRMCMGMSTCEPVRFCETHSKTENGKIAKEYNVNYVCVRNQDIIKQCESSPVQLTQRQGFITNPHYPSETQFRTCKWEIKVPKGHYAHIYLHEILLTAGKGKSSENCNGVIFMTKSTCSGKPFPTYALCDVKRFNSSITACDDVTIFLSGDNPDPIRFWFSFYVVPVPDLQYVTLFDRGLTCTVTAKPDLIYSNAYLSEFNKTYTNASFPNSTGVSVTTPMDSDTSYGLYIGLAFLVIFFILVIIIVNILLKRRRDSDDVKNSHKNSSSNSNSQTNCSEIQKRPLPDTTDTMDEGQPFLQQSYSVVADEIPRSAPQATPSSPTYAEIDECSDPGGEPDKNPKPKPKLVGKKSLVDNSKRELPAKPIEEPGGKPQIYYEIDDAAKDASTEKATSNKKETNKKSAIVAPMKQPEKNMYGYKNEKKLSNASNIYDECADIQNEQNGVKEKTYMDMTHKKSSDHVPYNKYTKDKVNQSKRILTKDKPTSPKQNSPYVDCSNLKKPSDAGKKLVAPKAKHESLSSDSDSDDISMVENELYEPFESAKV